VLAGRQHQCARAQDLPLVYLRENPVIESDPANGLAAPHIGPDGSGADQQRLVQSAACKPQSFEGQSRRHATPAPHQPHMGNKVAAECSHIQPKCPQAGLRLAAQKLAADFMGGPGFALHQYDLAPNFCQGNRAGGPRQSATGDEHIAHFNRLTLKRNRKCQRSSAVSPASANRRSHSRRVKLRAMEIVPSLRTIRCQPISRASTG